MSSNRYCSENGCDLSSWGENGGPCFLHYLVSNPFSTSNPQRVFVEEKLPRHLIDYINSAHNKEVPYPDDERLELTAWTIPKRWSSAWKGEIKRPIKFVGCTFEADDLVSANQYSHSVEFHGCRWPVQQDGRLLIRNCEFRDECLITGLDQPLGVQRCTFHSGLKIEFDSNVAASSPLAIIEECTFDSGRHSALKSNGDYHLLNSHFACPIVLDANGKRCVIAGITFERSSTIGVSDGTDLWLGSIFLFADMLISGGYARRQTPKLVLDAVNQFHGSKIVFENLDLGNFSSENFRFWNTEFHGVRFLRQENRILLRDEQDIVRRDSEDSEIYRDRKEQVLCGLKESYSNIKQSFDRHADHRLGNEFHASELWAAWQLGICQRRGFRKWLYRNFSWHALYYWISDFGQDWLRPFAWLLPVSALAFILYLIFGVFPKAPSGELNLAESCFWQRVGNAINFTLQTLTPWYRPEARPRLAPHAQWLWWVACLHFSATLVSGTFSILALRRRFKR